MPATPTPNSRQELDAELERLIEDRLEQQNTAARVRTVLRSRDRSFFNLREDKLPLASILGLVGATGRILSHLLPPPNVRPGGPFFLDHWLVEQEEDTPSSLERVPQALLCIGCEATIRFGEEAGRYVVEAAAEADATLLVAPDGYFRAGAETVPARWVRQVTEGGGETEFTIEGITEFRDRFPETLTGLGSAFWRTLLVKYQLPEYTSFTLQGQGNQYVEVGTSFPAGFKSVAWSTSNPQNVAPDTIRLVDMTSGAELAIAEANDGILSASTAGFTAVKGESRRYRLSAQNTRGGGFSADLVISADFKSYLGASSATSLDMAGLLALGNGQLQGGRQRTAAGLTAANGQYLYYAYEASGGDLTSIILDGAAPVLGAFQKLADVSGQNTLGAPVTMRVYRSNAPNAFLNNSLSFS